jgi:hypothetical protein
MGCGCNKRKKNRSKVSLLNSNTKKSSKPLPLVKISSKVKTVKRVKTTKRG